jgi:hypothetical protein
LEGRNFVVKAHKAFCGVVNFYSAGVVTHDRRIGSRLSQFNVNYLIFREFLALILGYFQRGVNVMILVSVHETDFRQKFTLAI